MSATKRRQCEAICSTHGQRCRAPARFGVMCGRHVETEPEADGDGEHVAHCNQLLVDAMNHPGWSATPGEVRHLIEHAWVALSRATGDE